MAKRILLFTGKGGVGKTTCAAATALRAAEMGYRTLVLSSDPAHSLADALDRPLGPEPELVAPNLWAQEVDLYYSMKKYWGNLRDLMLTVFRWQGMDAIAAEEMAALPGMNEGSVLLWLEQFYRSGDYDLIVVDSAPTGETLALLTLPQAMQWWVSKAFPFQKAAIKTAGFALRKTTGIPLDRGYEELSRLLEKLGEIQDVLGNSDVSSIRLVANPEKMVIEEARRAYTYLQLYGYAVDAVVVNRILPEEGTGEVLAEYVRAQKGHLREIDESFEPLPILKVPHRGREVFGLELLREIGRTLYGDGDPTALMYQGQTYRVTQQGPEYVLEVRLPFVTEGEVAATHAGDRLVVQVHGQRRSYLLPKFLAYYTLTRSRVENGWLRAHFAQPA
jgi:arsenite/tail-anchored protein-transporting ATPase